MFLAYFQRKQVIYFVLLFHSHLSLVMYFIRNPQPKTKTPVCADVVICHYSGVLTLINTWFKVYYTVGICMLVQNIRKRLQHLTAQLHCENNLVEYIQPNLWTSALQLEIPSSPKSPSLNIKKKLAFRRLIVTKKRAY